MAKRDYIITDNLIFLDTMLPSGCTRAPASAGKLLRLEPPRPRASELRVASSGRTCFFVILI